jgi:serine/threonine protein kinase
MHGCTYLFIVQEIAWLFNIWCIGPNVVKPVVSGSVIAIAFAVNAIGEVKPMTTMTAVKGTPVKSTDFSSWNTCDKVFAFAQVADCLNLLHAYGVFHGDMHTGNIMIQPDKTPIIIDLGTMSFNSESRKLDKNYLIEFLIDMNLDKDPKCPTIIRKWIECYETGDRNQLPNTINDICQLLGELSIGPLVEVNDGYKRVYPFHLGNNIFGISFDTMGTEPGFEEYVATFINHDTRNKQRNLIQRLTK